MKDTFRATILFVLFMAMFWLGWWVRTKESRNSRVTVKLTKEFIQQSSVKDSILITIQDLRR